MVFLSLVLSKSVVVDAMTFPVLSNTEKFESCKIHTHSRLLRFHSRDVESLLVVRNKSFKGFKLISIILISKHFYRSECPRNEKITSLLWRLQYMILTEIKSLFTINLWGAKYRHFVMSENCILDPESLVIKLFLYFSPFQIDHT